MKRAAETLILGWGNPGRLDDGLGPALVKAMERAAPRGITVDTGYQLQVEDAAEVARHPRVVFVDAARSGAEPFSMRRLLPTRRRPAFSTHSMAPEDVLALSRDLFDGKPEAWLLGIRGYRFDDFGEGLSPGAEENLAEAIRFLCSACGAAGFREYDPQAAATLPESRG